MANVKESAKAINAKIVAWRRHIHSDPEVGLETPKTAAFIVQELKKMGVAKIEEGVGGHGVVALIEGAKPGKILGMRADIDALKMEEQTGVPYASKNNWMHACGHDAHAAMLLGAAEMLTQHKNELKGTVKLIFQPAEESGEGARAMMEDGVLENPKLDAIVGLHTGAFWKGPKAGEIGYRFGPMMASTYWFTVTFHGKGGHGATPHLTVDPIAIACNAYTMLQTIVSRETSPLDAAVVTVASIQGGTTNNVIPQTCVMRGTLRSLSPKGHACLKERFKQICEEVAHAMRGSAEVEFIYASPVLDNNRELTETLRKAAGDLIGPDNVSEVLEPAMGGEDMGFFMEQVPGTFFFHPADFGDERDFPHHHPKFNLNEDVLWIGSGTLVQFALTWQD